MTQIENITVEGVGTGYKDEMIRLSFHSFDPCMMMSAQPEKILTVNSFMSIDKAEDIIMFLQNTIAKARNGEFDEDL